MCTSKRFESGSLKGPVSKVIKMIAAQPVTCNWDYLARFKFGPTSPSVARAYLEFAINKPVKPSSIVFNEGPLKAAGRPQ